MNPNRGPLGVWSLDVGDESWPAALAALGVLAALPPAAGRAAMDGAALAGPADASGAERSPNAVDAAREALGAVWDRAQQAARPGRRRPGPERRPIPRCRPAPILRPGR